MKEVVAVLQLWVMLFHVGVEHRHKISFLILNITLIYQIVKTNFFKMNGIIKYFITYYSEKKDIFSREMRFQDFEFDFLSPLHLSSEEVYSRWLEF